jgi:hypothetical protein
MHCRGVKVVCEYCGSVVDVYGVLESCKCVKVFCEYIGRVLDVY